MSDMQWQAWRILWTVIAAFFVGGSSLPAVEYLQGPRVHTIEFPVFVQASPRTSASSPNISGSDRQSRLSRRRSS